MVLKGRRAFPRPSDFYYTSLLMMQKSILPSFWERVSPGLFHPRVMVKTVNGLMEEFFSVSLGATSQLQTRAMQIEVVPWFFLLSHTKNRKVWVEKSLKEITQDIFKKYSDASFEMNLSETYKPFDCLVQCDQSDFAFLSWLWETHGVFYYFKFEKNKHTMVVADSKSAFKECKAKNVNFNPSAVAFGMITSWNHGYKWVNGKASSSDYNFEIPQRIYCQKLHPPPKFQEIPATRSLNTRAAFKLLQMAKMPPSFFWILFHPSMRLLKEKAHAWALSPG